MIVYSFEYLPFDGSGIDRIFAWSWLVFALFVVSGNGLHLLYQKKQRSRVAVPVREKENQRAKMRG